MIPIDKREVIEIEELRIHNILDYDGQYVSVTDLSTDEDDESQPTIGLSNGKMDWNRALAGKLRRVPLTPELLVKCGFVWLDQQTSTTGKTIHGEWHHEAYTEYPGLYYVPDNEPKYLHQIQNLYFAITGKELEIKL